jgi:hypothetical protein
VAFDRKGDLIGAAWQWKVWTNGDYIPFNRDSPAAGSAVAALPTLSPRDKPSRARER